MKNLFLILLCFPFLCFASESFWVSMNEALTFAKEKNKPVFVEYYADWCVPCQVMDANVFTDSTLKKVITDNFYAVRLNVESKEKIFCEGKMTSVEKCYSEVLKLKGTPSFVILDSNGIALLSISGSMSKATMKRFFDKILYEGFSNAQVHGGK